MTALRRESFDGVEVALTYFSKGGERVRVPHTRISAEAHGPPRLEITVREAGILDPLGRKLGLQDVATGARRFDKGFVVKSNAPEGARVWLHARVRRRIKRVGPGYRFKLADGRATAERVGLEEDTEIQTRAMKAVAAFARGMRGLEGVFREVAERLHRGRVRERINGWVHLTGQLDKSEVKVRVRRRGEHFDTVIQTDRALSRNAKLSDSTLESMGATLAIKRGVAVVKLPGICDDADRLFACIEASVRGTRDRHNAYR